METFEDNGLDAFFENNQTNGSDNLLQIVRTDTQFTQSLSDMFEKRQRLYDSAHSFYEDQTSQEQATVDPEVQELEKHIKQAKERVKSELDSYNKHLDNLQVVTEKIKNINMIKDAMGSFLERLVEMLGLPDCDDVTEYRNTTKTFFGKLKSTYDDLHKDHNDKMSKSVQTLKSLKNIYKDIQSSSFGPICPVCLTHEVDTYLDPCGHTFCEKCVRSSHCYICRLRIKHKNKLYFTWVTQPYCPAVFTAFVNSVSMMSVISFLYMVKNSFIPESLTRLLISTMTKGIIFWTIKYL